MKTKKISWQAIAIVVLALVLIASIALGVSGAWFQDADSAKTEATLGDSVTIRLVETDQTSDPVVWSDVYKTKNGETPLYAYPGDKLLGTTSILPGSTTPTVVRVKITPTVTGGSGVGGRTYYDANADFTEQEATEFAALITGGLLDNAETSADNKTKFDKYNSYLINTMLEKTKLTGWTKGASEWFYKDDIIREAKNFKLFDALKLSEELTNGAAKWKIEIKVEVQAIQAANLIDVDGNVIKSDWIDDMTPASGTAAPIKDKVNNYNTNERKANAGA